MTSSDTARVHSSKSDRQSIIRREMVLCRSGGDHIAHVDAKIGKTDIAVGVHPRRYNYFLRLRRCGIGVVTKSSYQQIGLFV